MNKTEYKVTVCDNGRQEWRNDQGKWHRLDGPAVINGDVQEWWVNGKLHRLDGPAFIGDKYQAWFNNGKRHRLDGPAIIEGGYQAWWIEGKRYTKDEFDSFLRYMNQPQTIPEVKTILIDGVVYKIERLEGQ